MEKYISKLQTEEKTEKIKIRDYVLGNVKVTKPETFVLTGKNNTGRFGWLVSEGAINDNFNEDGSVSALSTRDWRIRGASPAITDTKLNYRVFPGNTGEKPLSGEISQDWFAKKVEWKYEGKESVYSTLSLGSPAILWEGMSTSLTVEPSSFSHIVYPSAKGIKVIASSESIDPSDLKENWLIFFNTDKELRDMPLLLVLTHRPTAIRVGKSLEMDFEPGGFGAVFTSRLWGIKRVTPGEYAAWVEKVPEEAISDARRWSRMCLNYPVRCDEVGWVENETVMLANRFTFKEFVSDWKTKPLQMATLPPVVFLAQNVGAPVGLPEGLTDLNCATKYGPLKAVPGPFFLLKVPLPPSDHRAIVPVEGRMIVQDEVNHRVSGLAPKSLQYADANIRNEGGGLLQADLLPYDYSRAVPFYEAPTIDLYKWWYTFNATQVRQVYGDSVRKVMDEFHHTRYRETLNLYSHKSFVVQKREPYTGVEYPITFVWPTQSQYGFRNFNDANEASGHNAYCLTTYAKYYGDWTTLKANWNFLRYLHDPLVKVQDWAVMSSGATEYWATSGLDMLNSEAFGSLSFAYAAEKAGTAEDVVLGKVLAARSILPTVARFALKDYLIANSAEGDPWREFTGFYHFSEQGLQIARNKMGGVGMLDTSKGTFHELSLTYKMWAGSFMNAEQIALAGGFNKPASNGSPDVTQRLILGWSIDSLAAGIRNPERKVDVTQVPRWQESTSLYDLAILCVGDIPVFLSDWSPAEYLSGNYEPLEKEMSLTFRSNLGDDFQVKIYSQFAPDGININGKNAQGLWTYDQKTGWLKINLSGDDEKNLVIRLGEKTAPLHPYFTKSEY